MSYANKYYPDYKKLYPGVEITPEVLATLRASDRQMRRFEEELKAKGFEVDNEKQTAKFIPSREDSYERLVQDENCSSLILPSMLRTRFSEGKRCVTCIEPLRSWRRQSWS